MAQATPQQLRRAVARAGSGKAVSLDETEALLSARGADLERLMALAAGLRDLGHGHTVTYSRKVFIPLTMLCRDHCHYCTFAKPPAKLDHPFLTPDEVVAIAEAGRKMGCKEALFTLGDRPEERYDVARQWLEERGYGSTLGYLRAVAIRVIEETGLLPHLNPGVMSYEELARLKHVSASMGMMLETSSDRLSERGGPHFGSPDKVPAVRLRTIEDAGRLAIPFTTGILVGIGETPRERAESLFAIRDLHRRYRHVQEVIVQNFRAKPGTAMRHAPRAGRRGVPGGRRDGADRARAAHERPGAAEPLRSGAAAAAPGRRDQRLGRRVAAHARSREPREAVADARGVDRHHRRARATRSASGSRSTAGSRPARIRTSRRRCAPRSRRCSAPTAWPSRDRCRNRSRGRTRTSSGSRGRSTCCSPRRPMRGSARTRCRSTATSTRSTSPATGRREMSTPSDSRWRSRSRSRRRPPTARSPTRTRSRCSAPRAPALDALCRVADDLRAEAVGDEVTYVINRNINFTNVCYVGCRFCAFAQREVDAESYTLTLDQVADRAEEAWAAGATEVCMQGGIHPDLPGSFYFDLLDAIRARTPGMHIHAFSPMEVLNGATKLDISFREFLQECRAHGLGTIPGTAAEILDDDVRWLLTKGKLPADTWEEIVRTAHDLGIRSSSTIMFGHVDAPPHWVAHIRRLGRIQDDTGGFTEFVPLPFVHQNAPIYLAGKARPGATFEENLRMHAVARILLDGRIANIQVSWVKLGVEACQAILQAGANDFGGTLMEETISRMAGADWGIRMTPDQFDDAIRAIGRVPAVRTTTYDRVDSARNSQSA